MVTLTDIAYTTIPLYYKGGNIIAQRENSANTTTELRMQNFNIVIAASLNGTATGNLYLDDGDSIEQPAISYITFTYDNGEFAMTGTFDYAAGVSITSITVLGSNNSTSLKEKRASKIVSTAIPLTGPHSMQLS